MAFKKLIGVSLLLAVAAPLAAAPRTGVYTEDIDRASQPCEDFYQYANGAWRAKNPIPPSMVRWSRRWASGELAKDQLKAMLDDASRRTSVPKGSVEQLAGDHYAACMDESRVNALGAKPVQPLLAEIDAIEDAKGVQRMIGRFHELAIFEPFGLAATPDNHQPTQVIADLYADGIGLPDRDYYLKPDARFAEAREKYKEHVATTFELAGYGKDAAKAAALAVFEQEKALAEASLDRVSRRDPNATDHKTSFAGLQKMTPRFDWAAYFDAAGLPRADLNVSASRSS